MEVLQYICVMSESVSGSLVFQLETYNLDTNLTLTLPVTGIAAGSKPTDIAKKIDTQITTLLAASGASFTHITYPNQDLYGEFSVTHTDHIVCVMSQCDFEISLASSSCKAKVEISDEPLLASLYEVKEAFETDCGGDCDDSDEAIISKIRSGSAWLTAYLNNNIVMSTYLLHEIGDDNEGFFTKNKPLWDYYSPAIKSRYRNYTPTRAPFRVTKNQLSAGDREQGFIAYSNYQTLVDVRQPFDEGNEIIIAYIAGQRHIPQIIKDCVVKFVYFKDNMGDTSKYTVEGTSEDTRSHLEILKGYLPFLKRYKQ